VNSNEVCISVISAPHPEDANASGNALGASAYAELLGSPVIDETLSNSASSQSGIGSTSDDDQVLDVQVPPADGSVLDADVLRTTSTSTVSGDPTFESTHTSTAEALGVNILDGTVTASLVRGVATTITTGSSATYSAAGSVIENLLVDADGPGGADPILIEDIEPGMVIELDPDVFGPGSFVTILLSERNGSTSVPAPGQASGGTYAADLTVTMIKVNASNFNGLGPVEVIVSRATAHSDFPQTTVCGDLVQQAVSGHAFVLSEQTDPTLLPVLWGHASIPASGGSDGQSLLTAGVAPVASTGNATTSSQGTLSATSSTATSSAEVSNLCLLDMGGCLVSATAVRSQANSLADSGGSTSDDTGTEFLGLQVNGTPIAAQPGVNTVITLDGIGFLILNEQFCDGGGTVPCSGSSASGQTVRALRLVVTVPDNPTGLTPGATVIVSEAHADSLFS
jgi:hypothetical protein